ncbi:hypothetical protein [Haloarcula marismortui]|jgi:hypothetical protein|uniref:DUF5673 domain-containing protein n=1 Tax=Haloarcula marismortui ATCC 33800 TaxID=662476 RepID=M0K6C4_9EURY|nr:hypothetical protein [Haloarcula sinaiiensis]EMA16373.1 hypothetical protein C436_01330 [Haloarcula sinaiiensis ATCC 33800]QUJ72722.1 hypothetical protein KDQ40_02930 [Haloarcula sinaiiensis ATCC 33800]
MRPAASTGGASTASDPLFGGISGAYLGLLLAPPVLPVLERVGVTEAWALYLALVGTFAVVTTVTGWVLSGRPTVAVTLGATRARWSPVAIAAVYAAVGFASLGMSGVSGVLAFFFGLLAFLFGMAVAVMSQTRYTAAVTAGAEELTRWRASWPESAQRRRLYIGGAIAGVATVGFAIGAVFDIALLQYTSQVLFPSGFVLLSTGGTRTAVATENGLEIRLPVARRFYAWEELESYDLDAESLVITRKWGADLRFATAEIDDVSLAEWTLAERLSDD